MDDEFTLTLDSPITEEQWDMIADVDFDYTNEITFHTKHGKEVKFVKASAQPERLTDDDFETIRIHLNAYKEKLCNQRRWEEAEEYQRIIDRFMAFASAEPEIIRCKECRHWRDGVGYTYCDKLFGMGVLDAYDYMVEADDFCSRAERRE